MHTYSPDSRQTTTLDSTDQMSNQMDGYFNLVYTHELTKETVNGWLPDLVYSHELTKQTVNGWEPAPANADACCTVLIAA